jgi:hypothetical protein
LSGANFPQAVAVNLPMPDYEPRWLRLAEAVEHLCLGGLSSEAAQRWLIRAIQDQLRGDKARYLAQKLFRIPGYPMRPSAIALRSGYYDWPSKIAAAHIDWDKSTVIGCHHTRIIEVDLLLEVAATQLPPNIEVPTQKPKSASKPFIRSVIAAVHKEAKDAGEDPPNIKELPKLVRPRLQQQGRDAAFQQIAKVGEEEPFASQRRRPGKTLASEGRKPRK